MTTNEELLEQKYQAFSKGFAGILKMGNKRDQFDLLFAMRMNIEIENDPYFEPVKMKVDAVLTYQGLSLFKMGGHDLRDDDIMGYCSHCIDVLIQEISYIRYCGGDMDRVFEIWINKIGEMEEELHQKGDACLPPSVRERRRRTGAGCWRSTKSQS